MQHLQVMKCAMWRFIAGGPSQCPQKVEFCNRPKICKVALLYQCETILRWSCCSMLHTWWSCIASTFYLVQYLWGLKCTWAFSMSVFFVIHLCIGWFFCGSRCLSYCLLFCRIETFIRLALAPPLLPLHSDFDQCEVFVQGTGRQTIQHQKWVRGYTIRFRQYSCRQHIVHLDECWPKTVLEL